MKFSGETFVFKPGDICDHRKPTKRKIVSHTHRHIRYTNKFGDLSLVPEGQFFCDTVMRDGKELSPKVAQ